MNFLDQAITEEGLETVDLFMGLQQFYFFTGTVFYGLFSDIDPDILSSFWSSKRND